MARPSAGWFGFGHSAVDTFGRSAAVGLSAADRFSSPGRLAAFGRAPFFFCRFGFIGSARFLFFCRLCLCRRRVRAPGRVLGGRFFWGSLGRRRQEITRRTVGFAALFCFLCAFGSLALFCTASSGFAEIHTQISPLDRGLALCRGGFCAPKQQLFATSKTSGIKKETLWGFVCCLFLLCPAWASHMGCSPWL